MALVLGCTPTTTGAGGATAAGLGSSSSGAIGLDTTTTASADDTGVGTQAGSSGSEGSDPETGSTDDNAGDSSDSGSTTEGLCTEQDECPGAVCFEGACVSVASCRELEELDAGDVLGSGVYELDPDGEGELPPYEAYCELELMGGGWTLVLKADGQSDVLGWSSELWTNESTYQPQYPDLDHHEAKLASYLHVPLSEILVGMEQPIGTDPTPSLQWLSLPIVGSSLHALISPGTHVPTSLGRDAWKGLIAGSSLQYSCNREGLNVISDDPAYVAQRIGIIANEAADCYWADSRLGVGGKSGNATMYCGVDPNPTGNFAGCSPDNGDVNLPAFAVVLVR